MSQHAFFCFFTTHILFFFIFPVFITGHPEAVALTVRDNKWNLKCSNAPTVVAGSFLDPSAVTDPLPKSLPKSGSDQPWFTYLWCVPNTKTYLFLDNGRLEPPPITYRDLDLALEQALLRAQDNLTQYGDGPIRSEYNGYMTPRYDFYLTYPTTSFMVYARSAKGVLTWGILVAALTGLGQYVQAGYDFGQFPIVYQINDGQWGEVGLGYVGFIDPYDDDERCVYQDVQGKKEYCEDVAASKVIT